jgi:hypothetical protein
MTSGPSPPLLPEDLFAHARGDAPPPGVHDAVWGKVVAATRGAAAAGGAGAGGAALAKKVALSAGTKLVALGTVSGAAGTAILAVSLSGVFVPPSPSPSMAAAARTPAVVVSGSGHAGGARLAEAPPRPRAAPLPEASAAPLDPSVLAEEARLVTEARHALVNGYPERALALTRSTHALPVRALEPEELALEARALHALGRGPEAERAEASLRARFPDHALAR